MFIHTFCLYIGGVERVNPLQPLPCGSTHSHYKFAHTCIQSLQVNEKSCRLRMGAYRDGVKRKGDKIGMGV